MHAPIAQLDRVTDYESVGRGFESLSAYQKTTGKRMFLGGFSLFLEPFVIISKFWLLMPKECSIISAEVIVLAGNEKSGRNPQFHCTKTSTEQSFHVGWHACGAFRSTRC